ncbi:MAG: addiction module protein [Prosthecobacter sp.]|nr:addiction module protein [Prosthecobacter sp.]
MILELIPEVRSLSSHEKRQLAEELLVAADQEEGTVTVDAAILKLLDQRIAEHEANPAAVSSWEDVRARVFRLNES